MISDDTFGQQEMCSSTWRMHMQKTKKQHYVPRTYLEAFCVPGSHKLCVYDKVKQEVRRPRYEDVASQNCYYDIEIDERGRSIVVALLKAQGFSIRDDEEQLIEKLFAENIEPRFSKLLAVLRKGATEYTPFFDANCRILRPAEKLEFSMLLAYQYIRVAARRDSFLESSECLTQVLLDMNASADTVEKYRLDKERAKVMHARMILDTDNLQHTAALFHKLRWVLCVNKTPAKLWTSDSPIIPIPHVHNALAPQTGLASPGIEVVFPISPEAILIMYDSDHHGDIWPDLAFCATYSVNAVKHYNSAQIRSAVRTLISADDDFSFVAEEVQRCPQVLESPSVELHYGGRTYRPSGNSTHNSPLT